MSLAMFAAPFNNTDNTLNSDINNTENIMTTKRNNQKHNKTYKRQLNNTVNEIINFDKVNSILEKIHTNPESEDNELSSFNPPPKPESAGVNKTIATEQMTSMQKPPQPNNIVDDLDLNEYKYDEAQSEEYYKKMIPNYTPDTRNYNRMPNINNQDLLLQKLNYMISLLEENHDEKTNNVIEEVILYSFLGIFMIFIVDSFTKVGKYIR